MSGGRQTGTVPKTKHNSRVRRENPVNHIPNNLDWHESYTPQRVRKESNTNARLSDAGDDGFIYEDNPWVGLGPSNRTDDDELRWSNVKSNNITPERGNSSTNVDGYLSNRSMQRQENGTEDRDLPGTSKESVSRGRLKLKMEQSQRKIEELQQTQAALLSLRSKAFQQIKPPQMEEMQQQHGQSMYTQRNKAMQQVKPPQIDVERVANMEARLQTMQEYANIMQSLERDETIANLTEPTDMQCDQHLRLKLNELLAKKAQCDNILACIESENLPVGAGSGSSDGETSEFSRTRQSFPEVEDVSIRRDVNKQDNRELQHHSIPTPAYIRNKELKLEEVKNKLEQLQTLLNRVETLRDCKAPTGMNGETPHTDHHTTCKNCPANSTLEKLHTKKIDLEQKIKTFIPTQVLQYSQPTVESWTSSLNGAAANSVDYSSEEGEVEYDESPVKLCSTGYLQPSSFPKTSAVPHPPVPKAPSVAANGSRRTMNRDVRGRPRAPEVDMREMSTNTSAELADQVSDLQMQIDQMAILYQGIIEKQHVPNFSSPQPWLPQPPNLGYMQFMTPPSAQWHQHQLLINSLNQCCQLIWHQQRELAGLRQALAMIQDESRMYKCGGYGNNLNFDPSGLLWAQTSPQTLNNQVPPGNRANNYWDNFRRLLNNNSSSSNSYSRQNLLSGRNKSNEGSIAESLPAPRPSLQTDNLRRRKENHSLGNSQGNGGSQLHSSGDVSGSMNSCRSRRRINSNLKADATALFSLEQSVYSELETVIAQAERSPQLLLQLLSQLKNLRSQRPSPYEDGNPVGFENECELLEHGLPSYPNIVSPRIEEPRNHHVDCRRNKESILEDVSRLVERHESETFSAEVISEIIGYLCRSLALDSNTEAKLHSALSKFKGARLRQSADNLLCNVARILSNPSSSHPTASSINDGDDCGIEQVEEEGAVGGAPIPTSQQPKTPSVEAELAEADQTQCNSTDNVEVFAVDEAGLPNVELDNQELPPREENHEQPLQEP